jgi:hypothetical protein
MATRIIQGTLDTFSVDSGADVTYLGNTAAGSAGSLDFRAFRLNPSTTGDIIVNVVNSSGITTMEIFQEDAYTASDAPSGYLKVSNIAKNGKSKGVVGVTVTDATKNYVVLLNLGGYSEVLYDVIVTIP